MGILDDIKKSIIKSGSEAVEVFRSHEPSAFSMRRDESGDEREIREYRELAELFRRLRLPLNGVLLCPNGIKPQPNQIAALKFRARQLAKENRDTLRIRREEEERAYTLKRELTGDYGILSHLDTLMGSARRGQEMKWEVYMGYFRQGMEELKKSREKITTQGETAMNRDEPLPRDVMGLVRLLEEQAKTLARPVENTRYGGLYEKLRVFPERGEQESLKSWYERAGEVLLEGLGTLDEELREELFADYPALKIQDAEEEEG